MLWKDSKDYTIDRFTLDEPASFIETPVDTAGPFVLDGLDASGIVMPYIPEAYAESRDDDWPMAKADEAKADGNGAREGFPFTGYEALRIDISKPWLIKGVMAKRET